MIAQHFCFFEEDFSSVRIRAVDFERLIGGKCWKAEEGALNISLDFSFLEIRLLSSSQDHLHRLWGGEQFWWAKWPLDSKEFGLIPSHYTFSNVIIIDNFFGKANHSHVLIFEQKLLNSFLDDEKLPKVCNKQFVIDIGIVGQKNQRAGHRNMKFLRMNSMGSPSWWILQL